jgi:hypothetical protein
MKYKFQEPRLSFRSPFLIHQQHDMSSILAGAIITVIGDDTATMILEALTS